MRFVSTLTGACFVGFLCSCDGSESTSQSTTTTTGTGAAAGSGGAAGGSGGTGGAAVCGSANLPLPNGLIELGWDDGIAASNVREQSWQITVNGNDYVLADGPLHEAVRFELEHPAKIYGFAIEWAALDPSVTPTTELIAGLYPDFGHNGFDYWEKDPLFVGSRCAQDALPGELLQYVLPEPVVIDHPGLVYVGHLMTTPTDPVFTFDGTQSGDGTCALWDDCHSAMNLPEAEKTDFYNGVSFPFAPDFRVRLYVEYTDSLQPEDTLFQPPKTVSPGPTAHVSFGDYDNDGWDDMLTDGPTLWHNEGNGAFINSTEASGITALGISATGGVFGDYDNDGCLDVFLYAESYQTKDTLLHAKCDGTGTFENATESSKIVDIVTTACGADPANIQAPAAAAAWVDIDADGFVDLYIANFNCWDTYTYYTDAVWHNEGNGTFADWTGKNGFLLKKTPSRGAAPADFDQDGDVDIFINNYVLQANLLYSNNGDGTVIEKAKTVKAAGDGTVGYTWGHTIGAAWGDLNNDGLFDLISANLAHPRFYDFSDKTQVLIQQPNHTFVDISGDFSYPMSAAGLRYQETHSVPALADFDHDGNLDMAITCVYDGRPSDFYWGKGDGTFTLDAYHAGITTENGWGVAVSDVDNDGDEDLFAHTLFINSGNAQKGHYLQVRAIGNVSANRAALGSTVRVTYGDQTRIRHVQGGTGKGGQDSMFLHFGLGAATQVDNVTIVFPGGKEVSFNGPIAADQRVWLYEDGTVHEGFAPPP
ncbi:MAG: CRTAC1 family protein [Polyangiaceae bacterium]|nr:CRTAC1 family protein [Polyangiaceae bacterium]